MPETTVPQRIQTSFFCEDAVFDACRVFLAKAYFFRNASDESADVDIRMRGQEPQIVEVPRLVASLVLKSHDLFGGDFVQAVHGDWAIFRYVLKLWIGAKNRKLFYRKNQNFRNRDVH